MSKEKVKTVSVKELYEFIQKSNLMKYIKSEADLIRLIKGMTRGKPATASYFTFTKPDGKRLIFKVLLKNLEN